MYPSHYQGETQWYSSDVTNGIGYSTDVEELKANRVHLKDQHDNRNKFKGMTYRNVGPGGYVIPCSINDDYDKTIGAWLIDKTVYGVN